MRRRHRSGAVPTIDELADVETVELEYRAMVAGLDAMLGEAGPDRDAG